MTTRSRWSTEQDSQLFEAIRKFGSPSSNNGETDSQWLRIASCVTGRTNKQVRKRWLHSLQPSLVKSGWSRREDQQLLALFKSHGPRWAVIASHIPGRTDDACSKRYAALNPNLKSNSWDPNEDDELLEFRAKLGPSWAQIGRQLNRSSLHCRNRFRLLERRGRTRPLGSTITSSPTIQPPLDVCTWDTSQPDTSQQDISQQATPPTYDPQNNPLNFPSCITGPPGLQARSDPLSSRSLPRADIGYAANNMFLSPSQFPHLDNISPESSASSSLFDSAFPSFLPNFPGMGFLPEFGLGNWRPPESVSGTPLCDVPYNPLVLLSTSPVLSPPDFIGYLSPQSDPVNSLECSPMPVALHSPMSFQSPDMSEISFATQSPLSGSEYHLLTESPHPLQILPPIPHRSNSEPSPSEFMPDFFQHSESTSPSVPESILFSQHPSLPQSHSYRPSQPKASAKKPNANARFGSRLCRMRIVSDDPSVRPYACGYTSCWTDVEKRSFPRADMLSRHIKLHAKDDKIERPYRCGLPNCSKAFKNINGLQYHLQISVDHFRNAISSQFSKSTPNLLGNSESSNLDTHNEEDNTVSRSFDCTHPNCFKVYRSSGGLRYHMKMAHSREQPTQLGDVPPALALEMPSRMKKMKMQRPLPPSSMPSSPDIPTGQLP